MGALGARATRSALLTIVCSIWNNVAKIATFVHYKQCRETRAIFARFMHPNLQLSVSDDRDFGTIFDSFCCAFPDGCELHLESTANCHKLRPAQYEVTCTVLPSVSHALWQWSQGKEPLLPYQVQTTEGTPTPAVRRHCLPGARCTLHGATPAEHGPDHVDADSRGGGGGANPTAPSLWEETVAAVWCIQSLHLSRTKAQYLTPHLIEGVPWEDVWATMQQLAQPASEGFVATTGEGAELYGAAPSCRPVGPVHVQQPGDPTLHWMPIAVDGTSRHEASYVHCTLGGTSSPDQLASRWLIGGSEEWATLYAAAQEVNFDQQLWDAREPVFHDTGGSDRETLFFPCADRKAQILMANCKNRKAEAPQALVCWVCRCNRAQCLANFGLEDTIDG